MFFRLWSVCTLLFAAAIVCPAATITFIASFSPETTGATGSGSGKFVFDTTAQQLSIDVDWLGLSGTTTVSHIHCCVAVPGAGTAGVAVTPGTLPGFPAGVTSGTYATVLDLTLAGTYTGGFRGLDTPAQASARLLQGMIDGKAYFNIHTNLYPAGEIRGFLQPVPEPATAMLTGGTLCGLCLFALRRRGGMMAAKR